MSVDIRRRSTYKAVQVRKQISLFETQILEAHNKYRALHGCPPLEVNDRISEYCKEWAEHLAKHRTLSKRDFNKFGENIYFDVKPVTGEEVVATWYDEIEKFDYRKAEFKQESGHFSQVIWKESTEIGMGVARDGDSIWVVVNYNPPGNVIEKMRDNVPLKGSPVKGFKSTAPEPAVKPVAYSDNYSLFIQQFLVEHNKYRAMHHSPPLKLAKNVTAYAEDWATHLSEIDDVQHRHNSKYGENLFFDRGKLMSGKTLAKLWYETGKDYNFEDHTVDAPIFTQLLWKESTELGVGIARKDDKLWIVANYNPPGNTGRMCQIRENVLPAYELSFLEWIIKMFKDMYYWTVDLFV